jgi:uncharacterized damage-inducible protein DinB
MLTRTLLLTMFQYSYDTNVRLLGLAANVSPEEWDAPQEMGQRSLHETLFHLLAVEEEWLYLCAHGVSAWRQRVFAAYPDAASLRALADETYQSYRPYLERLTDDDLRTRITAIMPDGDTRTAPVWPMLAHMLYHSAQHRSECAFMLTRCGFSPGSIDFYGYGFDT